MNSKTFKVVLVGAGAIAEHHALALATTQNASLAGFIDTDAAKAQERASRFAVRTYASIAEAAADGVNAAHILVPPAWHARLALECIEQGMQVLIEKPLASSEEDCQRIAEAAKRRGVAVSVDHSLLFDPEMERARRMVADGLLGEVVGVDIIRSSQYPSFAGGALPAHYALAGEPFRDIGVHALYLVREFLGEIESVLPVYRSLGGDPLLAYDDWTCAVRCQRGTANLRISWNTRPLQSMVILHGTRGMLRIDLFHMFLSLRLHRPLPQAALRVINTLTDSLRPLLEMPVNTLRFILKRRRQYQGIHGLVHDFYARLGRGEPPAVSVADGASVVRWTEHVAREAERDYRGWNDLHPVPEQCDVLVTGGTGKLGGAIVAALVAKGLRVRVTARRAPAPGASGNVQYVVGDLGDPTVVDRAVRGAGSIVHAGAAMSGDADRMRGGTVVGTRNVLDSMRRHGVRRLVHISSLSVVDWAGNDRGPAVAEDAADEPQAERRGLYTQTKLEAERLVRAAGDLDTVILRPGQIWGGSLPLLTAAIRRRVGPMNLVLGSGRLKLPLVHVDDVVQAVLRSLDAQLPPGTILQLVNPVTHTQNEVMQACGVKGFTLRLPRPMVFALGWVSERLLAPLGRQSPFGVYRLRSAMARIEFRSQRAQELLGWSPHADERDLMQQERRRAADA